MYYCDRNCQKNDWKIHKLECKIYKNHYRAIDLDFCRFFIRLYLTLEHFPEKRLELFKVPGTDPVEYKCYDDLRNFQEEIQMDEKKLIFFEEILEHFRMVGLDFDREKFFEFFCKIIINIVSLSDFNFMKIGLSLFIGESFLEHSCNPNSILLCKGNKLEVRCIKNVSTNEKITINVLGTITPREERQKLLKENFYFTCSCSRCLDDVDKGKRNLFVLKDLKNSLIFSNRY